jgi:hypothetical protein
MEGCSNQTLSFYYARTGKGLVATEFPSTGNSNPLHVHIRIRKEYASQQMNTIGLATLFPDIKDVA